MNEDYKFPLTRKVRPSLWTAEDIIALLCKPEYMSPDDWRPVTMCAVVLAESRGDTLITGQTIWAPDKVTHLSQDGGLFQLNSFWNSEAEAFPNVPPMPHSDRYDPFKSMERAWILLTDNGTKKKWSYNMSWWTAYRNGSYKEHVSDAYYGMMVYRAGMDLDD